MDRTAWIVVAFCVIGLVVWEIYLAKQMASRPAPVGVTSGQPSPASASATLAPSPAPTPVAEATLKSAEASPTFAEKIETLRNSDVELRLTNRGGGIKEAILLKQIAENGQHVMLRSEHSAPIGAVIDQPSAPDLPEFAGSTEANSVAQFERTTADQ